MRAAIAIDATSATNAMNVTNAATRDRTPGQRGTGYHMARPPGAPPGRDPLPFHS